MKEERHLHVVDPSTGELLDECPTCNEWARKYNGVLSQLGQLRAQIKGDEGHELFPAAKRLHDYWRERCKHPRTEFEAEEFKQVRPRLAKYGEQMVRRAIDGAAYDPWISKRKNGSALRHDSWEIIMRKGKFEEFVNKAPYHLPSPERVLTLAKALAWLHGWEPNQATAEAQRRLR